MRVNYKDVKSQDNSRKFLSLKNDKDTEDVVILLRTMDDLPVFLIHPIKNQDDVNPTLVGCLGNDCPLCKAKLKRVYKVVIPLFSLTDKEYKIWERGEKIIPEIEEIFEENEDHKDIFQYNYRIKRRGRKGEVTTTYSIKCISEKKKRVFSKFDNMEEAYKIFSPKYTKEQLINYLETGSFDDKKTNEKNKFYEASDKRRKFEDDDEEIPSKDIDDEIDDDDVSEDEQYDDDLPF